MPNTDSAVNFIPSDDARQRSGGIVPGVCTVADKMWLPNRRRARQYARRQAKIFAQPYWAYHCRHCNGWHLTSARPRRIEGPRD